MKKKFIKRAIPAEISDKGGAYVQFVEKDTVPLDGVIVDAIDGSYCQGRPTLIPADKVTSNISRIDIAADALAELASEEYDGKTIVFTVRGNFASAKISATLKYVAPPGPTVDKVASEGADGIVKGEEFFADGTNLSFDVSAGDGIVVKWTQGGSAKEMLVMPTMITPTRLGFLAYEEFKDIPDGTELTFEFTLGGSTLNKSTTLLPEA